MNDRPKKPFESVSLPRKQPSGAVSARYRVYSEPGKFTLVNAVSALEALQASGLAKALRIERDSLHHENVFDAKTLVEPESAAPAQVAAAVAAPTEPALVAQEAKQDAPLSGDDVNKLLNTTSS